MIATFLIESSSKFEIADQALNRGQVRSISDYWHKMGLVDLRKCCLDHSNFIFD